MAEVSQTVKVGKVMGAGRATSRPAEPRKEPERAPREAQIKRFPQSELNSQGDKYATVTATAPADWDYEDILNPLAWSHCCHKVAKDQLNTRKDWVGSKIEVRSADHAWFAELYLKAIVLNEKKLPHGLEVICIGPQIDPRTGKACPVDLATGGPWTGRAKAEKAA